MYDHLDLDRSTSQVVGMAHCWTGTPIAELLAASEGRNVHHITQIQSSLDIMHIDDLGHKSSNSELKKKKIHKMTRDQVLHHVQI